MWEAEVKKNAGRRTSRFLVTAFQKILAAMTQVERDRQTKSITDKQAEWQKRNDEINQEADRRKAEVLQPILDQIKLALEDVRQSSGVDAIFDVGQNATIVAVNKNLDVSDRVIARLRVLGAPAMSTKAEAPKGAPAAKPVTGPVNVPPSGNRPSRHVACRSSPDSIPIKKPDAAAPGE